MRTIKTILIIMGVLIAAGFAFVATEIWRRATDPTYPRAFAGVTKSNRGRTTTAEAALVTLPPGSHIDAMTPVGSRLAVQATLADGRQQIILLEPSTAKVQIAVTTGTISTDTPHTFDGPVEPKQTMRPEVPRTP